MLRDHTTYAYCLLDVVVRPVLESVGEVSEALVVIPDDLVVITRPVAVEHPHAVRVFPRNDESVRRSAEHLQLENPPNAHILDWGAQTDHIWKIDRVIYPHVVVW